jgi:protein gp37
MNRTGIVWTDFTWNPFSGCKKISPGCQFCYAETMAERFRGGKGFPNGFDLTLRSHKLQEPLKLKKPTRIFVNSMSDFFLDEVEDEFRDQVVDVMEATPQHQYQVLTKRAETLLRYSQRRKLPPNFWAGVTVEDQIRSQRLDLLRQVKANIRFISAEPLLSPLTLNLEGIHWLISGGESGSHLRNPDIRAKRGLADYSATDRQWFPRPDRIDWVRSLRDQCQVAGVAFLHKQWGGAKPESAGRELDGRTWDEYPSALN